jgi:hypothetical protein
VCRARGAPRERQSLIRSINLDRLVFIYKTKEKSQQIIGGTTTMKRVEPINIYLKEQQPAAQRKQTSNNQQQQKIKNERNKTRIAIFSRVGYDVSYYYSHLLFLCAKLFRSLNFSSAETTQPSSVFECAKRLVTFFSTNISRKVKRNRERRSLGL